MSVRTGAGQHLVWRDRRQREGVARHGQHHEYLRETGHHEQQRGRDREQSDADEGDDRRRRRAVRTVDVDADVAGTALARVPGGGVPVDDRLQRNVGEGVGRRGRDPEDGEHDHDQQAELHDEADGAGQAVAGGSRGAGQARGTA
jgi:hypothetical protein